MARLSLDEIAEPVDPALDPALVAHERMLQDTVRQALTTLPPRQRLLVCLRFGLAGNYCYTPKEISRIMEATDHFVH